MFKKYKYFPSHILFIILACIARWRRIFIFVLEEKGSFCSSSVLIKTLLEPYALPLYQKHFIMQKRSLVFSFFPLQNIIFLFKYSEFFFRISIILYSNGFHFEMDGFIVFISLFYQIRWSTQHKCLSNCSTNKRQGLFCLYFSFRSITT